MKANQLMDFKDFYESIKDNKMPIRTAFKLNKMLQKIDEELKIYQITMLQILREYCEFDENGNIKTTSDGKSYAIKEGKINECNQKLVELNEMELDIPQVAFKIDELEFLNLSVKEMECLMPFIEE